MKNYNKCFLIIVFFIFKSIFSSELSDSSLDKEEALKVSFDLTGDPNNREKSRFEKTNKFLDKIFLEIDRSNFKEEFKRGLKDKIAFLREKLNIEKYNLCECKCTKNCCAVKVVYYASEALAQISKYNSEAQISKYNSELNLNYKKNYCFNCVVYLLRMERELSSLAVSKIHWKRAVAVSFLGCALLGSLLQKKISIKTKIFSGFLGGVFGGIAVLYPNVILRKTIFLKKRKKINKELDKKKDELSKIIENQIHENAFDKNAFRKLLDL